MANKLGTLTFLPTRWCTGNRKPVIPVNPTVFEKELQSFLKDNESGKKNTIRNFAAISKFPLPESTDEKLCTQKNVATAEIRSTLENRLPQSVPRKDSIHLDIGQIN